MEKNEKQKYSKITSIRFNEDLNKELNDFCKKYGFVKSKFVEFAVKKIMFEIKNNDFFKIN